MTLHVIREFNFAFLKKRKKKTKENIFNNYLLELYLKEKKTRTKKQLEEEFKVNTK